MADTKTINNKGKGSQEEVLPHRHAMTQLTKGDPVQRSLNNYAKKTPTLDQGAVPNIFGVSRTYP